MVLLVLLAGAVAVVYSLFSSGTIPGLPQLTGQSSEPSVTQEWQPGEGSGNSNSWLPDNPTTSEPDQTDETTAPDSPENTTESNNGSNNSGNGNSNGGNSGNGNSTGGNSGSSNSGNGNNGGNGTSNNGAGNSPLPLNGLADILSGGNS